MSSTEDAAVRLDDAEVTALAKRLLAMNAATDWLEWEDVPELEEGAFERLLDAVKAESRALAEASRNHDRASNIDSQWLLGRAHG